MPKTKHVIGTRFGRLTITERMGTRITCRCDCGVITIVSLANLCTGHTVSCGCLRTETIIARSLKHGHARRAKHHPLYVVWTSMMKRCSNTACKDWPNYGGRGITVCAEWRNSFDAFLADMGPRPDGTSLDRMNNDGNYEPCNCRWATRIEQNHNQRKSNQPRGWHGRFRKADSDVLR